MNNLEQKVKEVLDSTRAFLQADGGDIEFIKLEEGIVYVRMHGACSSCGSLSATLYDGIESILLAEVPGIIGVELYND